MPVVLQNTRHVDNPWFQAWLDGLTAIGLIPQRLTWPALRRMGRRDWLQLQWPEHALSPPRTRHAVVGASRLLLQTAYARRRGARVLLTVHNLRSHAQQHPRLEAAFWWLLTHLVTDVHALTAAARPEILAAHPALARARWTVVPHGDLGLARSPLTRGQARARTGLPQGQIALLFGTVRASKGFLAYARHPAPSGWTIVVAGECPDREIYKALGRQAGVIARLRRHTDDELADLLAACDLVVHPSAGALNSSTAVHALSAGRPVAVPATATFAELLDQVGPGWVLPTHRVPRPSDLNHFHAPAGVPDLSQHAEHAVRKAQRTLFMLP